MSLNWDLSEIKDYETVCFNVSTDVETGEETRSLSAKTNALIMQTMITGLGKDWTLDADFAPEMYARVKLIEKIHGALCYRITEQGEREDVYFTIEDIRAHIGLSTNASPVTRAKFLKMMVGNDLDACVRQYKRDGE